MNAKYYVYRNLRTGGFSVKYRGEVVSRLYNIEMYNVQFKVNEKGRQRVIKDKQKNVHAYAVCDSYWEPNYLLLFKKCNEVTYNPYLKGCFFFKLSEKPIVDAETVCGTHGKLYVVQLEN